MAGFTDWVEPNATKFYCYRVLSRGLNSTQKIDLPRNVLPQWDSDQRDSTLNAIYFTAIDYKFDWPTESYNRNYIIFFSNNKWKWAEDDNKNRGPEYNLSPPNGSRGTEWSEGQFCKEQAPVSKKVFFSTLEKSNIHLIGLLTPEIYSTYKNFFDDAPTPRNYKMIQIDQIDDTMGFQIKDIVVPEIQHEICTCRVRYELALVMDTT